jgi:3',5'-cyclic AMP phosphodiesterase CpdA
MVSAAHEFFPTFKGPPASGGAGRGFCSIAKNDSLLYTRNSIFVKSTDALVGETCDLRIGHMNPNATFTLAHLSDPHLAYHHDIGLGDFLNKRLFGYLKWWLRRRSGHHGDVLTALIHDVRASQPDHIVVTGDLTHLGLPAEFLKAKELLNMLGKPSQVTVIPGNHDAYVGSAWDRNLKHWADYIVSDEIDITDDTLISSQTLFPSLRVRNSIALIGVSTARPSSTFLAVGSIGKRQLEGLQKILIDAGQRGLFRVVLIHHPPVSGVVSWRKRLTDAGAFRAIMQVHGVDLILHGHAHRHSQGRVKTPGGQAPVIGISSASAADNNSKRRARYHLYRLSQTAGGWEVHVSVRSYLNQNKRFDVEAEYRLV